jgi:hypothetical protein
MHLLRFPSGMAIALSIGFAGALFGKPACSASEQDYFHACVKQEANAALRRAVEKFGENALYGYHNDITAEVFAICKQRAIDSSNHLDYPTYVYGVVEALAKAALNEKVKKELEAERKKDELDAPRKG